MSASGIKIEEYGGAVRITIERPERRNAYDLEMANAMIAGIQGASGAEAVVITGSSGSFCAGGALGQLSNPDPVQLRELFTASLRLVDAIRACPRPVIAAVDGPAAGGGNELVIACDFAIATRRSTFGQTGPRVGSAPVLGATNLAAVQIGEKRAKEMSFMCRRYTAEQAYSMGLINEVVADGELDAGVDRWLAEIHDLSPRYLEISKVSSNLWWNASKDNMQAGLESLIQAIGSGDMREGAQAFIEKRKPDFRGAAVQAAREGVAQAV